MPHPLLLALLIALGLATPARAQESPPRAYEHDRFVTQPTEAIREFQALKVSFDTDEDGIALSVSRTGSPMNFVAIPVRAARLIDAHPDGRRTRNCMRNASRRTIRPTVTPATHAATCA